MRTLTMEGTAGRDGAPEPRDEAGSGAPAAAAPWYSPHTGTDLPVFRGRIYPFGVMLKKVGSVVKKPPVGLLRGDIEGFSAESARRLREVFLTLYVPGAVFWSFTLTTHRICTPVEWRAIMMRFRQGVKRAGWAGVWRAELQRRKAPHAHVASWLPPGVGENEVRDLWLRCTGEQDDQAARKVAVKGKELTQDDAGWAVYMGEHHGKHKKEQLGWLGKQWGVWNRDALRDREPVEFELSEIQHVKFLKLLARVDRSAREGRQRVAREWQVRKNCRPLLQRFGADVVRQTERVVARILEANVPLVRPKLPRMHRGNLLRCVKGATVARILQAVTGVKVDANST